MINGWRTVISFLILLFRQVIDCSQRRTFCTKDQNKKLMMRFMPISNSTFHDLRHISFKVYKKIDSKGILFRYRSLNLKGVGGVLWLFSEWEYFFSLRRAARKGIKIFQNICSCPCQRQIFFSIKADRNVFSPNKTKHPLPFKLNEWSLFRWLKMNY